MKGLLITLLFFFIYISAFSQQRTPNKNAYISKFSGISKSLSEKYGIPSCVILGVAIIETNYGSSKNCRLLKNHFGIVGKNKYRRSKRYKSRYKQYSTNAASFIDFVKMISKKNYYIKLKGQKNCEEWVTEISKSGYSEKPEIWKERVMLAIKNENL